MLFSGCDGATIENGTAWDAGGNRDAGAGIRDAASGDANFDAGAFDGAAWDSSNTCEQVSVQSEPGAIPEVMIVLDKSSSMRAVPPGGTMNLWGSAEAAINSLATELDPVVAFGLAMYPAVNPTGPASQENFCSTGEVVTGFAVDNADAVEGDLAAAYVFGNTPTAASLIAVRNTLAATPKADPASPRIVVLVTDGAPNCGDPAGSRCVCTASSSGLCHRLHCLDDDNTVAAIEGLAADGVAVYVIGFAVSGWDTVLDRMAAAGGTGRSAHIPAENTSELQEALSSVTYEALPCRYELDEVPANLSYVKVVLDGDQVNPVSASPDRGWQIAGDEIELVGEACDTLRDPSQSHALDITIECAPVPLI